MSTKKKPPCPDSDTETRLRNVIHEVLFDQQDLDISDPGDRLLLSRAICDAILREEG